MTNSAVDLMTMVSDALGKGSKSEPCCVEFNWGDGDVNIAQQTNQALRNMDVTEQVDFLKEFTKQWDSKAPSIKNIVGNCLGAYAGGRLIYTLTPNGRQFRCWYGIPGAMTPTHVDSCGEGLLFAVSGSAEKVKIFVDALIAELHYQSSIDIPNGVRIWGFMWDFR